MVRVTAGILLLSVVALLTGRSEPAKATQIAMFQPAKYAPLEATLWSDLSDAQPDCYSLLRAAMIAGGCHSAITLDDCQARFDEFCRRRCGSLARCQTDRQRAEILFRDMHEEWLAGTAFQEHCYRTDQTLSGQAYNCLTSTILYLCLCRQFDIPARAVTRPTHVYCRLDLDAPYDVQTTCPDWFERLGRPAGGRVAPTVDVGLGPARELDDVPLIARIYYNRGTTLLSQNEYRRAAKYLELSSRLDPFDPGSRRNLIAAWNNWSLHLCDVGQFAESATTLARCLHLAPDEPVTLANDLHVHHKWIIHLCRQRQFQEAFSLLDECHAQSPGGRAVSWRTMVGPAVMGELATAAIRCQRCQGGVRACSPALWQHARDTRL